MAPGAGFEPAHGLINSQLPYRLGYPGIKYPRDIRDDIYYSSRNTPGRDCCQHLLHKDNRAIPQQDSVCIENTIHALSLVSLFSS